MPGGPGEAGAVAAVEAVENADGAVGEDEDGGGEEGEACVHGGNPRVPAGQPTSPVRAIPVLPPTGEGGRKEEIHISRVRHRNICKLCHRENRNDPFRGYLKRINSDTLK
ncbi:hypothetical protein GCM10009560_25900 [Nonomuraea longicatena]|uniref:Uncharacterized protein n=1 Tax=Nonomuraea longicatena TaxID=83682 RepID=A0ABN1P9I2_9ACTN